MAKHMSLQELATSGTGFEAARILLSKGAKVVMLNRNPEKVEGTINTLKQTLNDNIDVLNISMMDLAQQAKKYLIKWKGLMP